MKSLTLTLIALSSVTTYAQTTGTVTAGSTGNSATTQITGNVPVQTYAVIAATPLTDTAPKNISKVSNSGYAVIIPANDTEYQALRWSQGTVSTLTDSIAFSDGITKFSVNESGAIAGRSRDGVAVWSPGSNTATALSTSWNFETSGHTYKLNEFLSGSYLFPDEMFPVSSGLYINNSGVVFGSVGFFVRLKPNTAGNNYAEEGIFKWGTFNDTPTRLDTAYYSGELQTLSGGRKFAPFKLDGYSYRPYSFNNDGQFVGGKSTYKGDGSNPTFECVLYPANKTLDFSAQDLSDGPSPRVVGQTFFWQNDQRYDLASLGVSYLIGINNKYDILGNGIDGLPYIYKLKRTLGTALSAETTYRKLAIQAQASWVNLKMFNVNDNGVLSGQADYQPLDSSQTPTGNIIAGRPVILVPAELAVDLNRDGVINLSGDTFTGDDSDLTDQGRPFYFAANIDDNVDTTSPASTAATTGTDWQNNCVDGLGDLPDFFPVFLDIKQLLGVLPHTNSGITYKLKQAQGSVNFVYTKLKRETAFNYLTDTANTYGPGANQTAAAATVQQITATGVPLDPAFLTRIKDQDQGVILIEMNEMTAAPLRLVVEKGGVGIAEIPLDIKPIRLSLLSDLNNDGQINEADGNARNRALNFNASAEDISAATEYIFSDDAISNGAADTAANDDDAEKIQIIVDVPGISSDKIRLNFDAATQQALKFYSDEGLNNEITLPILLSSLPSKTSIIYARHPVTQNQTDAEINTTISLYCEVETHSGAKTTFRSAPIRVCTINRVPSRSFYKAAIDYIWERNSKHYVCEGYNYDSNFNYNSNYGIWLLVMRKNGTAIKAINAHTVKPGGAASIYDFATTSTSYTALVNGVFFNGTGVFLSSQTSQGQLISGGIYDTTISTSYPDRANVNQRHGSITIAAGDPASITPPHNINNYDEALGGLRSGTFRFPSGDEGSVIGIGQVGQTEFIMIAQSVTGRSANSVNGLWSFSFDATVDYYGFDGGASTALGVTNPLTGALTILPGSGRRHSSISPERICTYLGFECSPPR